MNQRIIAAKGVDWTSKRSIKSGRRSTSRRVVKPPLNGALDRSLRSYERAMNSYLVLASSDPSETTWRLLPSASSRILTASIKMPVISSPSKFGALASTSRISSGVASRGTSLFSKRIRMARIIRGVVRSSRGLTAVRNNSSPLARKKTVSLMPDSFVRQLRIALLRLRLMSISEMTLGKERMTFTPNCLGRVINESLSVEPA